MESKILNEAKHMTKKEFLAESDRLLEEARSFLADARRNNEESQRISESNRRKMEELDRLLLCGKK